MGLGLSVFRRRMKTPLYFELLLFIKIIDLLHSQLTTQIVFKFVFEVFFFNFNLSDSLILNF